MPVPPARKPLLLICLLLGLAGGLGPAAALSADAQKIVDLVRKSNPDLHPVCSNRGKLKAAVTEATTLLAEAKQLLGNPQAGGQEAGRYLYANCPAG